MSNVTRLPRKNGHNIGVTLSSNDSITFQKHAVNVLLPTKSPKFRTTQIDDAAMHVASLT